jgi:hypothetical protein
MNLGTDDANCQYYGVKLKRSVIETAYIFADGSIEKSLPAEEMLKGGDLTGIYVIG